MTAESLEFLTRGDVAPVAMQYSLRPSPLSLFRVEIGINQNNAFLHALKWRLAAIPEDHRPRLHIYGESLGAQTLEDVFADEAPRACTESDRPGPIPGHSGSHQVPAEVALRPGRDGPERGDR